MGTIAMVVGVVHVVTCCYAVCKVAWMVRVGGMAFLFAFTFFCVGWQMIGEEYFWLNFMYWNVHFCWMVYRTCAENMICRNGRGDVYGCR